ncbi:MAG: aconitase X [Candidatus Promineifilaceae bacterium]|jgi:predicted aconitase/predicted aconitase with swiveling domain
MHLQISLNEEHKAMLSGEKGRAKQMAMRLLLDMSATAGATELIAINSAHLSGVSPLTGGLGLRQFLSRLTADPLAKVAVPTTLNSAGCDEAQFAEMLIAAPNFLEYNHEIVDQYSRLGVRPTQSCIPYEWEGVVSEGTAAWAESNAICFGNSYCGLQTNRESGLSALACALTGYAPYYGLLIEEMRQPNLDVTVSATLDDPTDFSILGDWIGKQRKNYWRMPYGPIPLIKGLKETPDHEQKKALSAAAANYGCPLLYLEGDAYPEPEFQDQLFFTAEALNQRYEELRPRASVSLITIGCPQASVGEMRAVAQLLKGKEVRSEPAAGEETPPLWIFTSAANKAIAEQIGLAEVIRNSGALLLENTCPEVVPYDKKWVKHILTNSMKAEHYIKSGLNGIPTSVMSLADCLYIATGERVIAEHEALSMGDKIDKKAEAVHSDEKTAVDGPFSARGSGLPSQSDFVVRGEAFVSPAPVTFLGYVNRETGVIEEEGHPRDGQSMSGKIAIFPKGSGSSVAPYVLLELYYRDQAPLAILNTDIDQQSAPACSLEGIPYAFGFDQDIIGGINQGDLIALRREGDRVTITVEKRATSGADEA